MRSVTKILILILIMSLSFASVALAQEEDVYGRATDPGYIGVGARPMGMGKAYVALAEDGTSIFTNPAGLAKVDEMLFSSMYSNLMEEVNYMVGSFTYPLGPGTIALGYLGSSVSGLELYIDEGGFPVSQGKADYNNYVLYLSYGLRLTPITPDIMLGANIKAFAKEFTGPELVSKANGTGTNLDLGILYQPNNWLTLGVTQQNLLESSKMEFETEIKEDIPSLTKVGFNMTLCGRYGYIKSPHKLNIAGDVDFDSKGERENTIHIGAEYWPMEMLAIRAGIDQDPVPQGVVSNLTAGVGLRVGNIEFDYAYHTYYDIPENATSYFSISMVGPFDQLNPRKNFVASVKKPKDKMVVYGNKVELEGKVEDPRPGDRVEINGKAAEIDGNGIFKAQIDVETLGTKRILVKAMGRNGQKIEIKRDIFRLVSFKDVPEDHWARKPIEFLGTIGLVSGYPDGTFRPERTLTRAELATLLVRAKNITLADKANGAFSDVPMTHWAAKYIEAAKDAGLVKGYPDGTFRPDAKIKKAEGVTVMARLEGLETLAQELKEDVDDARFTDIETSWAAGYIMAADEVGLLEYLEDAMTFNANAEFNRAEAVEILSKTTLGAEKINSMLAGFEEEEIAGSNEIALVTR